MSNLTGPKEFAHHEQKKTKILTNIPGIAYVLLLSLWHHQFLSVKARDQQNQKFLYVFVPQNTIGGKLIKCNFILCKIRQDGANKLLHVSLKLIITRTLIKQWKVNFLDLTAHCVTPCDNYTESNYM